MSKSLPQTLTTEKRLVEPVVVDVHWRTALKRRVASAARWLHIYLSMASFAILFFFAVTGLTLNHAEYFGGQPRIAQSKGTIESKWIKGEDAAVDKLSVVEFLRNTHGIKGALADFRLDETQVSVTFKGPAYAADVFINRETGEYELTETRNGLIAALNDLHKGRDTGRVWSQVIDVSAVVMSLVSLTGMVLLWFVKRRRVSGFILAGLGAVISYLIYRLFIP